MNFDRLLRPDIPEVHTPQWQQGVIVGWIPAILTKIESSDDPEGLGRIRVQCKLISNTTDLPNSWDGFVWVLEEFVNNGKAGGAHRFLQIGSQIALLPMLGNPKQLLMLGAVHSRVDRPNPLFDRSKQVHGTHSPNQVFSIKDDAHAERTDAYPTGVTQQVSRNGDVIDQTAGGARSHLQADGTTRIENNLASTVQSAEGRITQHSGGDAVSILDEDGQVQIRSDRHGSRFMLNESDSYFTGPAPEIVQLFRKAQSLLSGDIGQAGDILGKLKSISEQLAAGANLTLDTIEKINRFMSQLAGGIGGSLGQGIEQLENLGQHSPDEIGELFHSQIEVAASLDLESLSRELDKVLGRDITIAQVNQIIRQHDEQNQLHRFKTLPRNLEDTLQALGYSRQLQRELILSEALPRGYDSISNLSALGLANNLGTLRTALERAELEPTEANQDLLLRALPENLRQIVGSDLMNAGTGDFKQDIAHLAGVAAKHYLSNSAGILSAALPLAQTIPAIGEVTEALFRKTPGNARALPGLLGEVAKQIPALEGIEQLQGNLPGLMQQLINPLTEQLAPQLEQGLEQINLLAHAIPTNGNQTRVEANSVSASLSSASGVSKVEVNPVTAYLESFSSRLYTDAGGIGASSPWGGFSFGKFGGLFQSIGRLGMGVLGKKSARLNLDPDEGGSLEGMSEDGKTVLSKVVVIQDTITLTAGENQLIVSPDGIFANGRRIDQIWNEFTVLSGRLASLENAATPPGGGDSAE